MVNFKLKQSRSKVEGIARTLHVGIGIAIIAFAVWIMANVSLHIGVFFVGLMLLGLVPICIGLFGQRKTVLQTLFLGYWF